MTTRADMAARLSAGSGAPTKTVVLEVHTSEPRDYLRDLVGSGNVEDTEDAYLFRAYDGNGCSFWVDQLDERFWSFHTQDPMRQVIPFLRGKVEERRDVDWVWLPSEHLRNLWPGARTRRARAEFHARELVGEASYTSDLTVMAAGRDAEKLLDYLAENPRYTSAVSFDSVQTMISDPSLGIIEEAVNRKGRFAFHGESIEFHLQFVQSMISRYRSLVESCERQFMTWSYLDDDQQSGYTFEGAPIGLRFSKDVGDMEKFLDVIFSSRAPYRLWGIPEINDGVANVEAVDLHVGVRARIDVGSNWMRIYLDRGACGNSIARLVSNLQSRFDSALELVDPNMQGALSARVI